MRAVIQRVSSASVEVDGRITGKIDLGLLVLIAVRDGDGKKERDYLCDKLLNLRIFPDEEGRMNKSILDAGGDILLVSQFTLYGDCRKGRRPSFTDAAPPEAAKAEYEALCGELSARGIRVATGEFQAHMDVFLVNDGPVTFILDTKQ